MAEISIGQWSAIIASALFLIAGISVFLTRQFHVAPLKLGVPLMIVIVGLAIAMLARYVFSSSFSFTFADILKIAIVAGIVVAIWVYAKPFAPELFSVEIQQIQSVLGVI